MFTVCRNCKEKEELERTIPKQDRTHFEKEDFSWCCSAAVLIIFKAFELVSINLTRINSYLYAYIF